MTTNNSPDGKPGKQIMKPSIQGYALIKQFSALCLHAYKDKIGKWMIGYQCAFYEDGTEVKIGDTITKDRASRLLKFVVDDFASYLSCMIKSPLRQQQFDALLSLAYDVGIDLTDDPAKDSFANSTILRLVNENPDDPLIYYEFQKYNTATVNGRKIVLEDLKNKRKTEADLYFAL